MRTAPAPVWAPDSTVDLREHTEEILWAATRAPSYRNLQPWSFRVTAHQVEVYADLSRGCPAADPVDRELFLGVGAAIFGVRLAVARLGSRPVVGITHDPAHRDLAAVVVSAGPAHSPVEDDDLYAELSRRRTVPAAVLGRPVPADLRIELSDR
ncbi:MAG TPA: nitroreductase family protein, partial [Mycobacteriales bacterium]|nr:nitroreductase family protein [Mycobacteriales bacterium]